ncbi:hypothetical protein HPP92_014694 [Vanilla planifolia]|nr:hypothetical protein HPP92_014694 [Vanilla planifolia]
MIYKGIHPNLSTFNTLIKGFCNERDSDSAMRVFKRMKATNGASGKERISPSADTYILLIRCLVDKEEFTQALQVCKECLTRRYAPPFETMKVLINGLAKTSKVDLAKYLVEKMRMVNKGDAVAAWTKLEGELLV